MAQPQQIGMDTDVCQRRIERSRPSGLCGDDGESSSTSRSYVVTVWINADTPGQAQCAFDDLHGRLKNLIPDPVKAAAFQLEQCPDTGRYHVQLVVQFKRSQRGVYLAGKLRLLSDQLWFRVRRGTWAQAEAYCTKQQSRVFPDGEATVVIGHPPAEVRPLGM